MNPETTAAKTPATAQERHGRLILDKLIEVAPEMITTRELSGDTGLSVSQTYRGLLWVKEVGAAAEGRAYAHSRKHGHGFPDEVSEIEDHETAELARARNIEHRLLAGTVLGHLQRWPDNPYAQLLQFQLENVVKGLDVVLEQGKSRRAERAATPT